MLYVVSFSIEFVYWSLRVALLSLIVYESLYVSFLRLFFFSLCLSCYVFCIWEMSGLFLGTPNYCLFSSFHLLMMWPFSMFWYKLINTSLPFYSLSFILIISLVLSHSFGLLVFSLHWFVFHFLYFLHITLTYLVDHLTFLHFIILASIFILDIMIFFVHIAFYTWEGMRFYHRDY